MDDKQFELKYTRGYNQGYLLGRFEPDLYKVLMKNVRSEHPYFKGMVDGNRAVQKELFIQKVQQERLKNKQQLKQGMK